MPGVNSVGQPSRKRYAFECHTAHAQCQTGSVTTQQLLKISKWNSAIAPASPKAPTFGALPPASLQSTDDTDALWGTSKTDNR